ncbi:MAG: hypothetical protein R3A46_12355 [Thermomicrobiales bacterium]
MDPRLPRDWGSQYGNDLDVVARGVGVRSLDERGPSGDLPGSYSTGRLAHQSPACRSAWRH